MFIIYYTTISSQKQTTVDTSSNSKTAHQERLIRDASFHQHVDMIIFLSSFS